MEAAKVLKKLLDEELASIDGKIWLIPSVDIHPATGRHDIDLLMIGYLAGYIIDDVAGFQNIEIRNFFTTIEIKSHTSTGLRREGTHLMVKYPNGFEDVTMQSEDQKNSLRRFLTGPLQQTGVKVPFITNLIWLIGTDHDDFDQSIGLTDSNILVSDSTAVEFFDAIGRQSRLRDSGYVQGFSSSTNEEIRIIADLFCAKSSGADTMSLRRMNIIKRGEIKQAILDKLNDPDQVIVLAGHAGTGKTIMLLQLADYLAKNGHKCLFLTYNVALIADLKHTMSMLNPQGSSFEMASMHSFLIGLMRKAGIWRNDWDINNDFEYAAATLLQVKADHPVSYDYEYVFVDEAQDWKINEADLLKYYCSKAHIVVADGIDQFMYSKDHTDWGHSPFPKLRTCLRQRSNLALFAKKFASKLGVYWDVDPCIDVPGGRVIISYVYDLKLHSKVYEDAKQHGCTAYDIMLLAPKSLVNDGHFSLSDAYKENGINIFDGIDKKNRDNIYGSGNYKNEECRVYTYESCRGLEAWTTVCLRFDQLFTCSHPHDYHEIEYDAARQYMLGLWTLMPLTRAVDTLVLVITKGSKVDLMLKEISSELPDFVTYNI